ncbi:hypothetical protein G5714_023966 [Onychostoma macrolepis]|uniref:Uncharacterized protein n=3 Tax=Onychostoma macrolepis TaxID=369639 RepID=A0A7J6BIN3_9TELE|nr:hypothetical protein G5714_023966 [Onychostoma macrolepis]
MISGAEVSDSCSLASSGYGSSEIDIRPIFGSSHSKDESLTSRFKSGVLKILNSMEFTPPLMSGEKRSNTSSLGSSAGGSFRSQSEADIRSLHSRDSSHTRRYESRVLKIENSKGFTPPLMSGDERSDTWSVGSSDYGSFTSRSGADSGSVFSSTHSIVSSHSSGFGSLQPISKHSRTKRTQDLPKTSKYEHKDTDFDTEVK